MTLKVDGTGTMLVELSGLSAMLFADRLRFNWVGSLEQGRLKKQTIGGDPADKVELILKTMGDRVDERILELTDQPSAAARRKRQDAVRLETRALPRRGGRRHAFDAAEAVPQRTPENTKGTTLRPNRSSVRENSARRRCVDYPCKDRLTQYFATLVTLQRPACRGVSFFGRGAGENSAEKLGRGGEAEALEESPLAGRQTGRLNFPTETSVMHQQRVGRERLQDLFAVTRCSLAGALAGTLWR